MLTQEEVKRLNAVEDEYRCISTELGSVRNSEEYKRKYRKGLSPEESVATKQAILREEELEKNKDALVAERNALIRKRDGNYRPDETNRWYPEPGYGPSW